jgi:hypothetical protein
MTEHCDLKTGTPACQGTGRHTAVPDAPVADATSAYQRAVRAAAQLDMLDSQVQLLQRLQPMPGADVPQQASVIAADSAAPLSSVSPADVAVAAAGEPVLHVPMPVGQTAGMDTTPAAAASDGTGSVRHASNVRSARMCRSSSPCS